MIRPADTRDLPADRTIRSSRVLPASREDLWTLFENPDKLASWWGPAGFTNAFHEFDFRPGGAWRFTMRGPDGAAYNMEKSFVTLSPPERIMLDHDDPVHGFRMFMEYHEEGSSTRLEWTMVFDSEEEAARIRPYVEPANEQNFDRLQAMLTQSSQGVPR